MDGFLARPVLHQLRLRMAQVECLAEQFDGFAKAGWRLGLHERAEFCGDLVHGIRAQAQGHALVRTHRVDGNGKRRDDAVDGWLLEQERLAAVGRFHFAVGDLGDFQFGRNRLGNAFEFARGFERVEKITKGIERHGGRLAEHFGHAMARRKPARRKPAGCLPVRG